MKFIWIICVISIFLTLKFSTCHKNSIEKAFQTYEIVPDILDVAPNKLIEIKYPTTHKQVHLGNEIAPKNVKQIPEVSYDADSTCFYTLAMMDPDAPSRSDPAIRSFQHWVVVNIPGSKVDKGEILTEYVGSGPLQDTGLHRYVFVVYKQPHKTKFSEPYRNNTHGSTRTLFSLKVFSSKYGLGNPVAGNFYQAKYDDSVPAIHQQLGAS